MSGALSKKVPKMFGEMKKSKPDAIANFYVLSSIGNQLTVIIIALLKICQKCCTNNCKLKCNNEPLENQIGAF